MSFGGSGLIPLCEAMSIRVAGFHSSKDMVLLRNVCGAHKKAQHIAAISISRNPRSSDDAGASSPVAVRCATKDGFQIPKVDV